MSETALNAFGHVVDINDIADRLDDPYRCRECSAFLEVRWGTKVRCFAHPRYLNPECRNRADESLGDSVPQRDYASIARRFGNRILQHLLAALDSDPDAKDSSAHEPSLDLMARAHIVTLVAGATEWHADHSKLKDRIDAAVILAFLRASECFCVLQDVIRMLLRRGFDPGGLAHLPEVIRRHVLAVRWRDLFEGDPLHPPDLWSELDGNQTLTYYFEHLAFVQRFQIDTEVISTRLLRNVEYTTHVTIRANWTALDYHVRLLRFSPRPSGPSFEFTPRRNLELGTDVTVSDGEGLIVLREGTDPRAYLYVMPKASLR